MSDLIERDIAIEAVQGIDLFAILPDDDGVIRTSAVEYVLSNLPSAQPEIVRCRDCKWFNDIGCAIRIVDDTDKPSEDDFCSFAERRNDG